GNRPASTSAQDRNPKRSPSEFERGAGACALAALVPTTRSGQYRGPARRNEDAGGGGTDQLDRRMATNRPVQQRHMNTAPSSRWQRVLQQCTQHLSERWPVRPTTEQPSNQALQAGFL